MKKRKVRIAVLGVVSIFIIAIWLFVPATQAKAKTVKFKYATQFTKREVVPVPGEKGHIVGLYERRGVAIFENEVAATAVCGTLDGIKKKVSFQGYTQLTFKDGSTWMLTHQGSLVRPPGEDLGLYEMKGEIIKGTGRFEGIKGKYTGTGRYITPFTKDETKGDNWMEITATYALPKK